MLLVNPRKRRKTRKRRTAAQNAATRKLVAMNRRRKSQARRIRNPIAGLAPTHRRRRTSPTRARVVRRRYRRNPTTARGLIRKSIQPAFASALGALGLDVMWGFAPVPPNWKVGNFRHLIKGAGAIAFGHLAGGVIGKGNAHTMTQGALTVIMHTAMSEFVTQNMPQIQLGYYSPGIATGVGEYVGSGHSGVGEYVSNGMGAYIGGSGTSPYLAKDTLSQPFAGPSHAQMAVSDCLESESGVGTYY